MDFGAARRRERNVMGAEDEYLWCRVEEERGGASRVNIMRPDGEILFSLPPAGRGNQNRENGVTTEEGNN